MKILVLAFAASKKLTHLLSPFAEAQVLGGPKFDQLLLCIQADVEFAIFRSYLQYRPLYLNDSIAAYIAFEA